MEDYTRDPCPWRIVDDCGGAFTIGIFGGSLFHFGSGWKNSPKIPNAGFIARRTPKFRGGIVNVKAKSPVTGGNFAVWGGMFSTIDCLCIYLRGKEDPWNSIFSGAATGFILALRSGLARACVSGVVGGVLLTMIEGVGILFTWYSAEDYNPANRIMEDPSQMPSAPSEGSGSPVPTPLFGNYQ